MKIELTGKDAEAWAAWRFAAVEPIKAKERQMRKPKSVKAELPEQENGQADDLAAKQPSPTKHGWKREELPVAEMAKMYRSGATLREVAEKFAVPRTTLVRALNRANIKLRSPGWLRQKTVQKEKPVEKRQPESERSHPCVASKIGADDEEELRPVKVASRVVYAKPDVCECRGCHAQYPALALVAGLCPECLREGDDEGAGENG